MYIQGGAHIKHMSIEQLTHKFVRPPNLAATHQEDASDHQKFISLDSLKGSDTSRRFQFFGDISKSQASSIIQVKVTLGISKTRINYIVL